MRNQSAQGALLVTEPLPLTADWTLAPSAPNEIAEPGQLHAHKLSWIAASVPGTVAQALAGAGRWDIDDEDDFDATDWWYRTFFETGPVVQGDRVILRFNGLATIGEVWLNGKPLLHSTNMFETYEVDVTDALHARNELVICFRSLHAELAKRRPRPRWKTRLVRQQQLRWIRTTLLGRIPGWTIPAAPVGPWRTIELETRGVGRIWDVALRTEIRDGKGVALFSAVTRAADHTVVNGELRIGDVITPLRAEPFDGFVRVTATATIDDVRRWWPHTHGEPATYPCALRLIANDVIAEHQLGSIGFRDVDAVDQDGGFALRVNGDLVFCRGACWTTVDAIGLSADDTKLREALMLLRDAGANMVRVGGTMVYEADAFYRLCDELGLMVWQDFMFANMDYPADSGEFMESVRREAAQQLRRFASHPCIVTYCGNSEVEQQAAMLGAPREQWRNALFGDVLPGLCGQLHPGTPYVPSTPCGGVLPFNTSTGLAHYYGVGAYQRPFSDVRAARVRFTPECLGFSNVPEPDLVDEIMRGDPPATHDPRWKRRTPRDTGAGWDFEDVRDRYTRELFALDPQQLRFADTRRYLEIARVTSGEAMARAFAEWRRTGSECGGALVWFHRDLWPGAGWGIVDSRGVPKACYYYLRRAWQPVAVVLTDEGLNGLRLHAINERRHDWRGSLELMLVRDGATIVAERSVACVVPAGGAAAFDADAMLGAFYDTTYAYRFGPPAFDVAIAAMRSADAGIVSTAIHFAKPFDPRPQDANVTAFATHDDDAWRVTLRSDRFLYAARFDVAGFAPEDNYLHVAPGRECTVRLRPLKGDEAPRGFVEALNLRAPVRIEVSP